MQLTQPAIEGGIWEGIAGRVNRLMYIEYALNTQGWPRLMWTFQMIWVNLWIASNRLLVLLLYNFKIFYRCPLGERSMWSSWSQKVAIWCLEHGCYNRQSSWIGRKTRKNSRFTGEAELITGFFLKMERFTVNHTTGNDPELSFLQWTKKAHYVGP